MDALVPEVRHSVHDALVPVLLFGKLIHIREWHFKRRVVHLKGKVHEERDRWVVLLDQFDGFLSEKQVVVLSGVVPSVARFVGAPEVGCTLARHREQRARPSTVRPVLAPRFGAAVVDGRSVGCFDGCKAVSPGGAGVVAIGVSIVRTRAHTVDTIAPGQAIIFIN